MNLNSFEEVKRLTTEMVNIPSINHAPEGEANVSKYVNDYYTKLDYFKAHPDQNYMFGNLEEPDRKSNIAYLKGTKGNSQRCVILIGHVDTVGVDDYGINKELAFQPDKLPELFLNSKVAPEVIEDIKSGQFMFGRGALDMKSGVAGHMVIMKYFAEHLDELDGYLMHVAECDEEDMSGGILAALEEMVAIKKKEDLHYIACINADYSTNYNPGDENRYIYYGCIGKTLPSYVVFGKESHVGQSFAALDPNLLLAEITRKMSLNTDLSDVAYGEVTVPPISLKQADTKVGYTVQTALVATGYYNFFTHGMSPRDVLAKSKQVAVDAMDDIIAYLNDQYRKFCDMSKVNFTPLPWKTRVLTFKEYYDEIKAEFDAVEADKSGVELIAYANNMPDLMSASDLIVSRAGAIAISEITVSGKPSVLVPSPNVTHNHQYWNARSLSDAGAALLIEEKQIAADADYFKKEVCALIYDAERLAAMAEKSKELGNSGAADMIVDNIFTE